MSTSITKLLRHPAANAQSLESAALLIGALVFVVTGPLSWLIYRGQDLPISGEGSLGQMIGITSAVVALVVFVVGRRVVATRSAADSRLAADTARHGRLRWFDIAALAIAHAVIALLGWIGLATVLSLSFVDAVVFAVPAAALTAVATAITAYAVFLSSVHLSPMVLSLVLAVFLVVGALASMLSASDPHWWKKNLSSLGMTDDLSALAFNLTLIIAGVLVTTIAHYAVSSVPSPTPEAARGRSTVAVFLAVIGVLLACVGVFPVDEFLTAHNISATGMAIVFTVLVLSLHRFIPTTPRVFLLLGYVYLGVIVVMAVFFISGYYNLTAVELVVAVLVFSWVIVFLRNPGEPVPPQAAIADERAHGLGEGPVDDRAVDGAPGTGSPLRS
ncbi:DUF998 domain-containing protein [Agromyces sp. NPDC058104]|uniref:DUF998 domain-containing protein n=1 Tax=Agromyces sp. NPDC058104 TaxID=3346342 RepID=UPI0036DE1540